MPAKKRPPLRDEHGNPSPEIIELALAELALDRPWYSCRLVGNRLEFQLYGGDVAVWPPPKGKKEA